MKNLTNEAGVTGVYTEQYMGTLPAEGYFGNGSKALVTLPRTVGLTVGYRFRNACRHAGRSDDRSRTGAAAGRREWKGAVEGKREVGRVDNAWSGRRKKNIKDKTV